VQYEELRRAKKIGYVFCGGSARCAFQIGAIEALAELSLEPALCAGVSAGAWNAAIVAAGIRSRIRFYWRSFMRMPHIDLRNLFVDHSPWRWRQMHERTFRRFVGERLHAPDALPLYVSLTRLRDRTNAMIDARTIDDPFRILIATNYLFPFFTHAPVIDGERYGDGGQTNNAPYEVAFANGCDAVIIVAMKGESEGGLFKRIGDVDHEFPPEVRDRVVVIRPRHRLPIGFTERRWSKLSWLADLGYLRTREVLLGEEHAGTHVRARGKAPTAYVTAVVRGVRRLVSRESVR
jgi:predicted acylesterase/phospholipase RssA